MLVEIAPLIRRWRCRSRQFTPVNSAPLLFTNSRKRKRASSYALARALT